MIRNRFSTLAGLVAVCLALSTPAYALDTIENYDPGASDYEFYLYSSGLDESGDNAVIGAELALGFGIYPNVSGYLALAGEGNGWMADGGFGGALGLFGTPLDSDHVDLDFILEAAISTDSFALIPALELNVDLVPDQGLWGVWLLVSEEITGTSEETEDDPVTPAIDESGTTYSIGPTTGILFGTYVTIEESHQLLLGVDMSFANNPGPGERIFSIGSIFLGYNVALNDTFELITELSADIPQSGESLSYGISAGFVASLPQVGSAAE